MSTVAYAPSPLPQGGGSSTGGLVATAGMFTATSSEAFCSQTKEQRQQGITRAPRPPGRELPQARQASAPGAVSACWAPTCFPTLPGTLSVHRGQLYMEPLWVKQTRERQTEKAGDCGNSPGSEGPVSTSVYVLSTSVGSAGGRGVYPGALTYLQGLCSVFPDTSPEPILALNKRGKQDRQPYCTHLASSPGAIPAVGHFPGFLRHLLGSYQPAQTICPHSLHRGRCYTRPLFQD